MVGSRVGKKADGHRAPFHLACKVHLGMVDHRGVGWGVPLLAQVSLRLHQNVPEDRHEGDDEDEVDREGGEPYAGGHEVVDEEDDGAGTGDDGEQRGVGDGLPGR